MLLCAWGRPARHPTACVGHAHEELPEGMWKLREAAGPDVHAGAQIHQSAEHLSSEQAHDR